jgi:dTDP-4-amino-4,6-dideoxygalactose transaminase
MAIPLFDSANWLAPLRERFDEAIARVLDRGVFVLGPELRSFEEEFAAYLGVTNVIGVGNGTDAITLALRALGVGAGDEVVVPSFTFYASAEAILPTGARPVFCDVDADTFCVTAETVKAALTPATKAIVAVDLFGNPVPADELLALGLPVIEDAAQGAGSTLAGRATGSLGTAATFSFYPSKNLPAFGDGGAVATDDDELASRLRSLRSHGSRDKVTFERIGYNSRLDELQAAVLRVSLGELDGWAAARRDVGRLYEGLGLGEYVKLPTPVQEAEPAWHLYVVKHENVAAVEAALARAEIGHRGYYRTPVHRQPSMRRYVEGISLPVTEELAATHLAIPMGPSLGAAEVEQVVSAVSEVASYASRT